MMGQASRRVLMAGCHTKVGPVCLAGYLIFHTDPFCEGFLLLFFVCWWISSEFRGTLFFQ